MKGGGGGKNFDMSLEPNFRVGYPGIFAGICLDFSWKSFFLGGGAEVSG